MVASEVCFEKYGFPGTAKCGHPPKHLDPLDICRNLFFQRNMDPPIIYMGPSETFGTLLGTCWKLFFQTDMYPP